MLSISLIACSMINKNKEELVLILKLEHTETDSTFEYSLIANTNVILNHFSFKKNNIKDSGRYRHISNNYQLFSIFDYIYIPSKNKVYILMDEWGKIRLYSFHFDPYKKEIGKIKDDGKLIFSYDILPMDMTLFKADNKFIGLVNDEIYLLVQVPYSQVKFIKIPTDSYQKPKIFDVDDSTQFIYVDYDNASNPVIPIHANYLDTVSKMLEDKIEKSPYNGNDFEYCFTMQNRNYKKSDNTNVYIDDSYFFCKLDKKNIVIHCYAPQWIFSEYTEVEIDPNASINISNSQ